MRRNGVYAPGCPRLRVVLRTKVLAPTPLPPAEICGAVVWDHLLLAKREKISASINL
jgi:hypothetical protein